MNLINLSPICGGIATGRRVKAALNKANTAPKVSKEITRKHVIRGRELRYPELLQRLANRVRSNLKCLQRAYIMIHLGVQYRLALAPAHASSLAICGMPLRPDTSCKAVSPPSIGSNDSCYSFSDFPSCTSFILFIVLDSTSAFSFTKSLRHSHSAQQSQQVSLLYSSKQKPVCSLISASMRNPSTSLSIPIILVPPF